MRIANKTIALLALLCLLPTPLLAAAVSTPENPVFLSVIPPLLTIVLALLTRSVIPALFIGVLVGSWGLNGLSLMGLWEGILDSVGVHVIGAVADTDHASIMIFSFMIGGMVGIVSRNGGMNGLVNMLAGNATDRRRGQMVTAGMGMAIFIDDYANSLVVGNTMRPVTDKLRISREKLAYLVDSTAAPITCVALITTWIGYEVGLIGDSLVQLGITETSPYEVFLNSILYSFYPLLTLFMVVFLAWSGRDYGPMYKAEVRAIKTGQLTAPDATIDEEAASETAFAVSEETPQRMINSVVPILVLIGGVLGSMYFTGSQKVPDGASVRDVFGEADAYTSLVWGSLLGVLVAAGMTLAQKLLRLSEIIDAWYRGVRGMFLAMIILVLAWSLSNVTLELGTGPYLVSAIGDHINVGVLPGLVFVVAALTAFSTGSSWGAMGILMPLVIPLAWAMLGATPGIDPMDSPILYSAIASVLCGAVWGDHCSPISDTTVLSSLASGCDHVDHVRTQLPYAMTAGGAALILGGLPSGFGMPWWMSLLLGAAVIVLIVFWRGKKAEEAPG